MTAEVGSASGVRFRGLSAPSLFALGFGTVIGVGWIVLLGDWLSTAGSLGAVIAFGIGAVLMALVASCYAELASVLPHAGGEIAYAQAIFGERAALLTGWLLTLIYVATTAFEAISVAWLLGELLPRMQGPVVYRVLGEQMHVGGLLSSLGLLAIVGFMNHRGAAAAARLQNVLTGLLVAVAALFITAGFIRGDADHLQPWFADAADGSELGGVLAILVTTPFWYAGFNVIPQALHERAPKVGRRAVRLVLLLTVAATAAFYILVIVSAALAAPRAVVLDGSLPAATAFSVAMDSRMWRDIVLVAGLLGLVTTCNAVYFAAARVLAGLGERGWLPQWFARRDAHRSAPSAGVWAVGLIAGGLTLAGRPAVGPIVSIVGICFAAIYAIVCCATLRVKRVEPPVAVSRRPPAIRAVAAVALLVSLAMLTIALHQLPNGVDGRPAAEWLVLAVWLALGVVVYFSSYARRALRRRSA